MGYTLEKRVVEVVEKRERAVQVWTCDSCAVTTEIVQDDRNVYQGDGPIGWYRLGGHEAAVALWTFCGLGCVARFVETLAVSASPGAG